MLHTLRKRLERDEDGFTLIELMVVVLIIAILLAIAIPTFLGARQRAQDRAAQSDIRNALTAEKTFYTDNQVYTATTATLSGIEAALTYVAGNGTTAAVGVALKAGTVAGDNNGICISKASKSGANFSVLDVASGTNAGTYYYKASLSCSGEDGAAAPTVGVKTGW
ncbi:MAG: type pilus assembly protein PilA [Acidimicrobiaceae bacterium]|jgi:type IV pilus assembly protein PilA|nr:type pilus assembly protein PilA [Acidimicrobiaceae bacterium]MDQ1445581.1 type pilus assembly protein PilA [Acidimicrobiaceae bacterium]